MKVLWFVSSLEQKGGGERFVLEGAKALYEQGHNVKIVCDRLGLEAGFDGQYDLNNVTCTGQKYDRNSRYIFGVLSKVRGLISLYRVIKKESPELIICQSEYDAIKLFVLSKILHFKYRVFVFGQMFQFKHDISKYSSVFKEHLYKIRDSRPGYKETVITPSPKLPFSEYLVNEIISRFKYKALRAADRIFTLSYQVKWEVELLYRRQAQVCNAAFNESYLDKARFTTSRKINNPIRFLTVSRLADKKRIDLIINAFSQVSVPSVLIIVGTGPEEERLHGIAASSSRKHAIKFLGAVTDAELDIERANADCFISMDIGDFDISVIEAMGKGLKVIVPTDFDLTAFSDSFTGVHSVAPNVQSLIAAMGSIEEISKPSLDNLQVLNLMTWQNLAKTTTSL